MLDGQVRRVELDFSSSIDPRVNGWMNWSANERAHVHIVILSKPPPKQVLEDEGRFWHAVSHVVSLRLDRFAKGDKLLLRRSRRDVEDFYG